MKWKQPPICPKMVDTSVLEWKCSPWAEKRKTYDFESNVLKSCNVKGEKIGLQTGSPALKKKECFPEVLQPTACLQPLNTTELHLKTSLSQISTDPIQLRKYFTFKLATGLPCGCWLPSCLLTQHNSVLAQTWYTSRV